MEIQVGHGTSGESSEIANIGISNDLRSSSSPPPPPQVSMKVVVKISKDENNPAFVVAGKKDSILNVPVVDDPKLNLGIDTKSPTSPIEEDAMNRNTQHGKINENSLACRVDDHPHNSKQQRTPADCLVNVEDHGDRRNNHDDPKNALSSISLNLFQSPTSNSSEGGRGTIVDIAEDDIASMSVFVSDSSFTESQLGDESKGGMLTSYGSNMLDNDDADEKKDQAEFEGGKYIPRHDVFSPSNEQFQNDNTKELDDSPDKRQLLLFQNLDRSFEKNISTTYDGITVCTTQEVKDIVKMCFSAMAVVFSSHNPSVTTMSSSVDTSNSSTQSHKWVGSDSDVLDIQDVIVQHKTNQDVMKSSSGGSYMNTPSKKKQIRTHESVPNSPAMSSKASCISDDKEEVTVADTLLNEKATSEFVVDNMDPIQRPSVPKPVVHMLWKQLIKYRLYDRTRDKVRTEMASIISIVQNSLVEELAFLEHTNFTVVPTNNPKSSSYKESSTEEETFSSLGSNVIECLQINHDIHLQYGRYISNNISKYFPFYLVKRLEKSVHFIRIYEEENWNPEEALNALMSKTCVKFMKKYASKNSDESTSNPTELSDILRFEYAVEMLPWHLMRSMLYFDVVDLITDYSFVHNRLDVLDLGSAVQMHIADAEELYNCINNFMAWNPHTKIGFDIGQILVQSYSLLSGIIHCENSNLSQDGEEKLADDEIEQETKHDTFETRKIFVVSKAFQAFGDSLSRCNMRSEAMKFYHRALDKFESIDAIVTSSLSQQQTTENHDSIRLSQSHLLMGGILSRIAFINEYQKNNSDAMLCYERALSFYSRHKSNQHCKGVAKVLASMGQLHFIMKEYDSAYSCLRESLSLWKTLEDVTTEEIANLKLLLGHVEKEKGRLNEALILLSEAMYDKINVYGKSHPEVGFLRQTIGAVFCDKGDYHKGLSHFDHALRIRESALKSVLTHFRHNETNARIEARELEVAESLQCIGKVYEHLGDVRESFSFLVGNVAIHRSHLLAAVSNQASVMVSDVSNFLDGVSGESGKLSNLYRQLILAIQVGKQVYSIDAERLLSENEEDDEEKTLEVESQMAEILYDLGLIEAAQFMYRVGKFGDETSKLNESLRSDAKCHFEQSITIRKRMIKRIKGFDSKDDDDDQQIDYENITVAVISYELGKLFCGPESCLDDHDSRRRRNSMIATGSRSNLKRYAQAASYFEDARKILEDSIEMAETLDYINNEDDCWISRLHKTPEIFEDMLHTLAVLYRKLEKYDKSVECYNSVSFLLTRNELGDDKDTEANAEKNELSLEKVKVADSSQSIGDVLFDTGEFSKALKSYEEALQLRRAQESDSLIVAETLCLKGNALLKLKKYENAIIAFDEAFRIRVEKLPKDHKDIATCFHLIGNAYEGDEKLYQALEYYKKAHKILSKHVVDTDTEAADLFYDLGKVILLRDASLKWSYPTEQPSEEEIDLAFTSLELCRDIYRRNFGEDALEFGNALDSLGVIHLKYQEYDKAVSSFKAALKIFHGAPMDQSAKIAKSLNNMAVALMEEGTPESYDLIFDYLDLSKETYEEKGECNSENYAELVFNIGEACIKNDEDEDAIKCFEKSVAIYESVFNSDHLSVSVALEKLGHCLIRDRQHSTALTLLQRALDIRTNHGRQEDLHCAEIHFNLGIAYCESGKLNEAIDCYEVALKIKTNTLGDDSIEVAQILNNIGSVFARNKEYQRALKPWQDAVAIYRSAGLSEEDPKLICTIGNIEISKRFVSPRPTEDSIRSVSSY